jgi:hypothetical protein
MDFDIARDLRDRPWGQNARLATDGRKDASAPVRMVFIGRFEILGFLDFVSERAARLALDVVVEAFGTERFEVWVSGQPGLIDAFEMACSLGPLDCLVLEVLRP